MAFRKITKDDYTSIKTDIAGASNILYMSGLKNGLEGVHGEQISLYFKNKVEVEISSGSLNIQDDNFNTLFSWSGITSGKYTFEDGETWQFEEGWAPVLVVPKPVNYIKSEDYTDFGIGAGHPDWVFVNGYTGTGTFNTSSALTVEIKTDTHIVPWNGTLSLTVHEGSTEHKWALNGQGTNPFDVKVGEVWIFQDGQEPFKRPTLRIDNKIVTSLLIDGKPTKTFTLEGKTFTFYVPPIIEDTVLSSEYTTSTKDSGEGNIIILSGYTGSLTGTDKTDTVTITFNNDVIYETGSISHNKIQLWRSGGIVCSYDLGILPLDIVHLWKGDTWRFENGKAPVKQ